MWHGHGRLFATGPVLFLPLAPVAWAQNHRSVGREVAIAPHLQDGEEFELSIPKLNSFGKQLFRANWTIQEGAGRPLTKGTGAPLVDSSKPLIFPRNFNRISGPDSNSCAGCYNETFVGGGSDAFPAADARCGAQNTPALRVSSRRSLPVIFRKISGSFHAPSWKVQAGTAAMCDNDLR